ncbi:MAG TPA: DUF3037 domain-containing protein [Solirubrobacterales bacterium]|nr:DUF3037 domain-containing protein [Solirubrobacterales bacterium]
MPEPRPFAYAVIQVVPCLQRGERLNAGLALFCRQYSFLDLKLGLDRGKLETIAPEADFDEIAGRLEEIREVIRGEPGGGALAGMEPSERFGWLVAPSSTIIQASVTHTGLTPDPAAELERLFESLVR